MESSGQEAKRSMSAATFCLGLLVGLIFAAIYGEWMAWSSTQLWLNCTQEMHYDGK